MSLLTLNGRTLCGVAAVLTLALSHSSTSLAEEKTVNVEPTLTVAPTVSALSTANPGGTVAKLQPLFTIEKPVAASEDDQQVKRCFIKVTNIDALPKNLFQPAPYLKPLGENTNASRAWVYVLDQDGNPLSTFATITDKNQLNKLWFTTQKDVAAPKKLYIDIWDRQEDVHYRSKMADVP